MHQSSIRNQISGIIGNFLEHYDTALFGLLAPFLAPLFFPNQNPLNALILTYGILCSGILVRPLGALFFGWIGDFFGRRQALSFSLLGMSFVTIGIGFVPTYQEIGVYAPIFLTIGKILQSFFAAGESIGGAIFVLEHTSQEKQSLFSSLYDSCAVGGMLFASAIVACMSQYTALESTWRILFWGGGITATIGFYLRWNNIMDNKQNHTREKLPLLLILHLNKQAFISIVIASGFSYAIYSLAFSLLNGYIPLVTSFSKTTMMQINTLLLAVDMGLLPVFGLLSNKFGKEKVMMMGAISSSICAIPLFAILQNAPFVLIIFVRLMITIFGVAFSATYHAWAISITKSHRYLVLLLAYSIGSQCIGMPTSSICLWLYKITNWSGAPGIYLMFLGFLAFVTLYSYQRRAIPLQSAAGNYKTIKDLEE